MLDQATRDTFLPYLNQTFTLDLDGQGSIPLQLTSVTPHPAHPEYRRAAPPGMTLREEGFSLTFSGPRRPALPQRIYRLNHSELGVIEMIFLVPVGEDATHRYYEAVFN